MARRRGHGEGSISQRADGRWQVQIDLGRSIDGKRRRRYAYADSEREAVKLLKRLAGRAADGRLVTASTPTVARFLEQWYALRADDWRPSTRRAYRWCIDDLLVPAFGSIRLEGLTPAMIQGWLLDHKQAGGARRRVTLAHAVLRSALSEAQNLQLVTINAASLVRVPQPAKRTIAPLSVDDARALLDAAGRHRLHALFAVALACGLRQGEALGLKWDDVDLTTGTLRVRQQLQRVDGALVLQPLKTERSRRTLTVPQVCLAALRHHRTRQLEERMKAGSKWQESGLVFTTFAERGRAARIGAALDPRNVNRVLVALLKSAKLRPIRFHDLRHSAASLLIASGVELVEVSMLLGHSELRVTADLYSHLSEQTSAKAAGRMDALLSAESK